VTFSIVHATWGPWPSLRLASPEVEIEVVGEIGARVVSLRDRRRGRQWLLQGDAPTETEGMAWSNEGAAFWGRESFGWDECLPTVSVCVDPTDRAGPPLRDHGDQWGRGTYHAVDADVGAVEHTWTVPRWPYRLSRRLSFRDPRTVVADYRIVNLARDMLSFLWSQHAVLGLEPGCRLDLPDVRSVVRTSQHGIDLHEQTTWPMASLPGGTRIDLSCVHSGLGWAAKLYAQPSGPIGVIAPDGARLVIDQDRAFAPALGIWLAYGGWPPDGGGFEQVALEPTTSPDDHLETALASRRARTLGPHEECSWWVSMTLA